VPAHSGDRKEFGELPYARRASSITAMLYNIEAAIEHHAPHSPHRPAETGAKCIVQVERLLERLRAGLPPA
jgi:hypothetical protein